MPNQLDLLKAREEEVRKVVELLGERTNGFEEPKLVLIGGYALRAFLPFSRDTRDCDFALGKGDPWHIDSVKQWLPADVRVETEERKNDHAFLRCIKLLRVARKPSKVSVDFMEGKVVSRQTGHEAVINADFLEACSKVEVAVGSGKIQAHVPTYPDYLLLKIISARSSDVRDIAALVWKHGVPRNLEERATKIIVQPGAVKADLRTFVIPTLEDKRFLDSWRGMFITTEFTEEAKQEVLKRLRQLIS